MTDRTCIRKLVENVSIKLVASTVAFLPLHAHAQPAARLTSATYSGSGCPQGSVSHLFSQDAQVVSLIFNAFDVALEAGPTKRAEKSCQVRIGIAADPGWSYAVFCTDFRGYAQLENGVAARHQASYTLAGRRISLADAAFTGPLEDSYSRVQQIPLESAAWSECSDGQPKALAIDTQLSVTRRPWNQDSQRGLITLDTLDAELRHHYALAWRRCARKTEVDCTSSKYRYTSCPQSFPIAVAEIVAQYSGVACRLGHSYGIQGNTLWVNHGCRARFRLTEKI